LPLAMIAIVLIGTLVLVRPSPLVGQFRSFNSYYELKAFVLGRAYEYRDLERNSYGPMMSGAAIPSAGTQQSTAGPFTTTNIQVEGVDEPDQVKTDGTYLYVVSQSNVFIIQAYPPGQSRILTKLSYPWPVEGIFLSQGRLVVIGSSYPSWQSGSYDGPRSTFTIYDLVDKTNPTVVKEFSVQGSYINSRLTSGYVYAIVQQSAIAYGSWGNPQVTLPSIVENGKVISLAPSDVYFNPTSDYPIDAYTIILSIRVSDAVSKQISILSGFGSTIYASLTNIYLTFPNNPPIQPMVGAMQGNVGSPSFVPAIMFPGYALDTTIFRIAVANGEATVKASGTVPGRILNQFSMDEYNGYLRVATTSSAKIDDQKYVDVNNVYVLNEALSVIGSIEGLALTEHVDAVRFMGDRAYLVTFQKTDPLFVISLDNPRQPKVVNELKMPGFSQYLHPIGNGYIIGIGKNAIASEDGYFAWYQGLKISLFRDDNGNLTEVANLLIGDRGSDTPVLNDHRAFTYDAQRNIMALPLLIAKVQNGYGTPPYAYGDPVWQGAMLFQVGNQGFKLLGNLTQMPQGEINGNYPYFVNRVVLIGDFVYTISEQAVQVNDLGTMSQVTTIQLQ
jgi:inhibitor of cysteine peptidase